MHSVNIYQLISLDQYAVTPKYIQLSNSIVKSIESGKLIKGYLLPSINELSFELDISRDSAEKAYKHLKKLGVIGSVPGKGYFIRNTDVTQPIKVLLLFNKLSAHKKILYDSFAGMLGERAAIDFHIYNNDFGLFKKLLQNKTADYSHYVIIPHFLDGGDKASEVINEFTNGKLILLDKLITGINKSYSAVYENFEKDIFGALKEALPQLEKYHTLKIVFPADTYFPEEILKGFQSFCNEYAFNYNVVRNIAAEPISEGEVYINLMEDDLVVLLGKITSSSLVVGENIGIISYNETPWKQFILDGITTISTDFKMMGEMAAQMVLHDDKSRLEVPFYLTLRKSL